MISRSILLFFIFLLSACSSDIDRMSATALDNYTESSINASLIVGKTTKKDVLSLFGVPTYPQQYNEINSWVYKSQKRERYVIFLIPVNNDKHQILTLNFDDKGVLLSFRYDQSK